MTATMAMRRVTVGEAHAKVIVVGEHAAVFGCPVLAAPLPALTARTEVRQADGPIGLVSPYYTGPLDAAPAAFDGVRALLEATLARLSLPHEDMILKLSSAVPIGRGLGSSAALAASLVRALYRSCGESPDPAALLDLIDIAETFAHGAPSGVDAAAVVADGMISFRKGLAATPVRPAKPLHFVVADSGVPSATRHAVAEVRARLARAAGDTRLRLREIGRLAEAAVAAASGGDAQRLGEAMNGAQRELDALGVSHPALDHLVQAARRAGALGAKLTGGGQGGCVLGLAEDPQAADLIALALRRQGATATWLVGPLREAAL